MMRGFLRALQFLTIIRVSKDLEMTEKQLASSMAYFPLVGLVVGLILAGVWYVADMVLPSSVADVMVIITLVVVAGSLHLDGLADTVDGLAGGKDRERILAIMRDSQIGSFAVVALILVLLLKVVALIEVPADMKYRTLLVTPVVGRWSTVQLASCFRYARSGPGVAQAFTQFAGKKEFLVSSLITAVVVIGLFLWYGVLIVAIIGGFTMLFGLFFKRRIGGVTGDIMGAACELVEVLALLLLCALFA
jgi:adenosylcobinamide-GDP ribazoletransferase